jgi:hypothetical protein
MQPCSSAPCARTDSGAAFDDCYTRGLALDEPTMIALAFTQLDAIIAPEPGP